MLTVDKQYNDVYEVQKSKFLAFAYPVAEEQCVQEILGDLRKSYKDATHICYAFILKTPSTERAYDDGEPAGSSGLPLLELLKKKGLENILLVVVRYFGGIKLGGGGLIRAYTTAGNIVLKRAKIVQMESVNRYKATCNLKNGSSLKNTIVALGGRVICSKFADKFYIEFNGEIQQSLMQMYEDIEILLIGSDLVCQ